ncbi:MAG TPA: replication terminator protein [Pelotomaculum sp.]|nr:replication terminator protein [Pelotomaculum sp.]
MPMFNLENLAEGALAEQIEDALGRVIQNIADPNTAWKTKRKLNITLTFQPDEKRELAEVNMEVKPTLAPAAPTKTRIIIGQDVATGEIAAAEYRSGAIPGQVEMVVDDKTGDVTTQDPTAGLRVVR